MAVSYGPHGSQFLLTLLCSEELLFAHHSLTGFATATSKLFGSGTSDGILPIKECLALADEFGTRDLSGL